MALISRPYFREAYYAQTIAQLRASAETNQLARGDLAAGFGRAKLSPTVNAAQDAPAQGQFRSLPMAGYGGRHGRPATGIHDDLYVKAVALRVQGKIGVMVGADALIIPREVTEMAVRRLEKESGLTREQLYLSATHTHSSLGGWGEGLVGEAFAGGFQPGARVWFADCLVAAVKNALADLKPAQFGHGQFNGFAVYPEPPGRRIGEGGPRILLCRWSSRTPASSRFWESLALTQPFSRTI